jgi:two-component system chemotaxis sensor kinase CheA
MSQEDINKQAFREEAADLLAELETALLELEENPEDRDLVDRVFRAMHTIKGSGAMFGFDDISTFTHDVETVFDLVRNGEIPVTKELLDLTLKARDHIKNLLDASDGGEEPDFEQGDSIIAGLKVLLPEAEEPEAADAEPEEAEQAPADLSRTATYRIRFKPNKDIFLSGTNPLALIEELCELGEGTVVGHVSNIPTLEELDPESMYVWWDVILNTASDENAIRDVFIFVEDECEITIQEIARGELPEDEATTKKLGEILVDRGDVTLDVLQTALDEQKKLGDLLTSSGVVDKETVHSALAEQEAVRQRRSAAPKVEAASSIRIAAEKLDDLVDLVGELVIVQAQISQVVGERNDPMLSALSEQLERLSDELRDNTLSIRMLPIGTTFSKFRRLVRDLSAELGKEIELETEGAETELDKTVIERLGDPLVHLLRNSIDHGVETPENRKAAGKPSTGTILLAAEHSGGEVLIRIKDDGKGMDPEALKAKAVERGVIAPDAEISDREAYNLIFAPGFSTSDEVTSVSGRGVGMDVVKRGIDQLRGSVSIESEKGKGTEITIKLPLTLAIIDGLQIRVQDEFYVIPLSLVEECVELSNAEADAVEDRQVVNLRGEIVPYIKLRDWFNIEGEAPDIEQVVVTGVDGSRVGIVVDNVIGEHQTVIKSLGRVYRDVDGLSGATIKGDGTMALILDVPKLVGSVVRQRRGVER